MRFGRLFKLHTLGRVTIILVLPDIMPGASLKALLFQIIADFGNPNGFIDHRYLFYSQPEILCLEVTKSGAGIRGKVIC